MTTQRDGEGRFIEQIARLTVDAGSVGAGVDVLDVLDGAAPAAGAGILAAQRGAPVVGLGPDEAVLDGARRRAADAGVVVDWMPGDPAELPCPEESMDVVLSVNGIRTAAAAAEVMRVLRPGGRFVLADWQAGETAIRSMFEPWGVTLDFEDRHAGGREVLLVKGRRARTA